MPNSQTVLGALKLLFPHSEQTRPRPYWQWPGEADALLGVYAIPPLVPFDAFGIAAYLLEHSGAYHHITAKQDAGATRAARGIQADNDEIALCRKEAETWCEDLSLAGSPDENTAALNQRLKQLPYYAQLWRDLFGKHGGRNLFVGLPPNAKAPDWWPLAHRLLMIADEACRAVGFTSYVTAAGDPGKLLWFERLIVLPWIFEQRNRGGDEGLKTLSSAHPDVTCVLPKARTTAVGCTLRSISHHLALLPPRGVARGRWYTPAPGGLPPDDVELNLLLVPLPFSIDDSAIKPVMSRSHPSHGWGFFEVEQNWIPPADQPLKRAAYTDQLTSFITKLVLSAKQKGARSIDGIILPELAMDYALYKDLGRRLKERMPEELEIFISGLVDNTNDRRGNFVAVWTLDKSLEAINQRHLATLASLEKTAAALASECMRLFEESRRHDEIGNREKADEARLARGKAEHDLQIAQANVLAVRNSNPFDYMRAPVVREKHHRWRLDRGQIAAYSLDGSLNPKLEWWENLDLLSRRVDFTTFREKSVLAAMICEDLARVDPCQTLLRAVGPNLVVALLMDAPQRVDRWPSRYATVLADDPGCSVLTFTSRGLMTRQHRAKIHPSKGGADRVVGLWKDAFHGKSFELHCPYGYQGVWLKLWSSQVTDYALDGRDDQHGKIWIYGKHEPVAIPNCTKRYPAILGADDCAVTDELAAGQP